MTAGMYMWSQTASNNATADSSVNWAEGQSPSSVNDSARAMMASAAKWRDDMIGANLATGGSSTAYTLASNQVFDSTAHMAAQALTIYPHVTNGATPTLNVDGLGAFPIVTDGAGTAVPAGTMIAGSPYELTFVNSFSHWRLKNFYVKPYEMPVGASTDYWGSSVPNSSFAFLNGQAISRTTYATLFALIGTTYGNGDGSTTFNLPDATGRITAMKESVATRLTSSYFGGNSTNLGAVGGSENHTLTLGELPTGITSSGAISGTAAKAGNFVITQGTGGVLVNVSGGGGGGTAPQVGTAVQTTSLDLTGTASVASNNTSGSAHAVVQPTIICNKIMRII